jgi:hypothetical protein
MGVEFLGSNGFFSDAASSIGWGKSKVQPWLGGKQEARNE